MPPARRAVAGAAVALAAAALTACTGSSHPGPAPSTSAVGGGALAGAVADTRAAVRWWSNSGAAVGSVIAPADPLAVARTLRPSRKDYCGMLRQTVGAGHAVLPGVTGDDPALRTVTTAFTAELQHAAPPALGRDWATLASAAVALVTASQGGTRPTGIDAAAVRRAAAAVATDARQACGVDLSKRTG